MKKKRLGADEEPVVMGVIRAGGSAVRIEEKGWKKGHGRSATADTRTTKSIAVLCSQPCGTVVTVMWPTFLGLVDIWAKQAKGSYRNGERLYSFASSTCWLR